MTPNATTPTTGAQTTLTAIREHGPCADGWKKLLTHLGKTRADDEPLSLVTILDSNGLDDALWCLRAMPEHNKHWRLYAVWCARQVQHLMSDARSVAALDVAERHAHGQASDQEMDAAWDAARDAAWDAQAARLRGCAAARSLRTDRRAHHSAEGRIVIEHNSPIEIRAVGNGYVVTPAYRPGLHAAMVASSDDDTLAFESRPSLLQWLSAHFDLPTPAYRS